MRVFLSGATGFIGGHIAERLIRDGHTVVCYTRSSHPVLPQGALSTTSLKAVELADRVYHVAGVLGGKGVPMSAYHDAHVRLTRDILMRMEKGQQFMYMSSAYVLMPEKPYEISKLEGESATRLLCHQEGIDFTILRPGFVFGEGDRHLLPLFRLVKKLGRWFPVIGNGSNLVCPTYVGDVVESVMKAEFRNNVVQVCGRPVMMKKFIWSVADAVGVIRTQCSVRWVPKALRGAVRWDFFTRSRVFWSDVKGCGLGWGLDRTYDWYLRNGLV